MLQAHAATCPLCAAETPERLQEAAAHLATAMAALSSAPLPAPAGSAAAARKASPQPSAASKAGRPGPSAASQAAQPGRATTSAAGAVRDPAAPVLQPAALSPQELHARGQALFAKLQQQRRAGARPNEVAYLALSRMAAAAGKPREALAAAEDGIRAGCQPRLRAFQPAMLAFSAAGQPTEALQVRVHSPPCCLSRPPSQLPGSPQRLCRCVPLNFCGLICRFRLPRCKVCTRQSASHSLWLL